MHAGVTVDRCRSCGGFWFDIDEINTFLSSHPDARTDDSSISAAFKEHTDELRIRCTCCEQEAVERGEYRGLSFQRCTWCGGLFFGRREIERIIRRRIEESSVAGQESDPRLPPVPPATSAEPAASIDQPSRSPFEELGKTLFELALEDLESTADSIRNSGDGVVGGIVAMVLDFVVMAIYDATDE